MGSADLAGWTAAVKAAEIYANPEAVVRTWWGTPSAWPLVLEFRGRPLQYDCLFLDPEGQIARSGFMAHLVTRPRRFWREAWRPVLEALREVGVGRITSRPRADLPEWVETLRMEYGAEEIGRTVGGKFLVIAYDVERALAACTGWPARRSAGPAWAFRHGGHVLRELQDADLGQLDAWLARWWHLRPALRDEARRLVDEWTALDAATILIGEVAGQVEFCRVVRERRQAMSTIASVSPLDRRPDDGAFLYGVCAWHRAVGYATGTAFVPDSCVEWDEHAMRARFQTHRRLAVTPKGAQRTQPFREIHMDADAILAQGVEGFLRAYRQAGAFP
jgi:hypothetical protein